MSKKKPIIIPPTASQATHALRNDHTHEVQHRNRHGATVTTRHYSWNSVEIEEKMLRRSGIYEVNSRAI